MVANQGNSENGYGIASMVLGIVGVVFSMTVILLFLGIVCGILAIVFAVIQRKRSKNGMATAGLILGIVAVALGVLIGVLYIALIATFFGLASSSSGGWSYLNEPFYLVNSSVQAGSPGAITLTVRNDGSEAIRVTEVKIDFNDDGCLNDDVTLLPVGESRDLVVECPLDHGEKLRGDVLVYYNYLGDDSELRESGWVSVQVE